MYRSLEEQKMWVQVTQGVNEYCHSLAIKLSLTLNCDNPGITGLCI